MLLKLFKKNTNDFVFKTHAFPNGLNICFQVLEALYILCDIAM